MRGAIPWDEEPDVSDNVVAVTFMDKSASTPPSHRPCTKGYRLHCGYTKFQLYNNNVGDTFVFIQRSPSEHQSDVVMSVALQKFSGTVSRVCWLALVNTWRRGSELVCTFSLATREVESAAADRHRTACCFKS